jgi:O-antigen biosynthesis protein WbqV
LWPEILFGTLMFAAVAALVFRLFGMHRRVWRYASMSDLIVVVKSATVAVLVFLPLMFLANRLVDMPRSVPVIQWLALVAMLGGPRFTYRLLKDQNWDIRTMLRQRSVPVLKRRGGPVLLLGACDGAAMFIRAMASDRDAPYRVVGVLDEVGNYLHRSIHNVPVLDTVDRFEQVLDRLPLEDRPRKLIIASQTTDQLKGAALRRLLDLAEKKGITVARLPSLVEFKEAVDDGKIDLRPIPLEDLLSRSQAVLDRQAIDQLIGGRRVLVTGAGGTIGGELARQIAAHGPAEMIVLDHSEYNLYSIDVDLRERSPDLTLKAVLCDIRDRAHVERIFAEHEPELVFHAAALKHVPLVELNPFEGVRTNVLGSRNIADAARRCGALAMVQVSTDKAVNPTNVMGATKRMAESYCQALDHAEGEVVGRADGAPRTRFMTVRFGNVLGSSGSVVPLFQRQLANGGPLTVTHPDITRYFMTVREAVELVVQASAYGVAHAEERGRIFVLDMGDPVKIVDVAHRLIRLAGLQPEIDVNVEFVGLRPGEKLYEELFDDEEERLPAPVDGVELALSRPADIEVLGRTFDAFAAICATRDREALQKLLKQALPSYRPPENPVRMEGKVRRELVGA